MNTQNTFFVENGSLINRNTGVGIQKPSMLLDVGTGILVKCGEADKVKGYYERVLPTFQRMDREESLLYVDLCGLTSEEQSFLFNKLLRVTSQFFINEFVENLYADTAKVWLAECMWREPDFV